MRRGKKVNSYSASVKNGGNNGNQSVSLKKQALIPGFAGFKHSREPLLVVSRVSIHENTEKKG